jgi:RimJ/RimL family protein N-acetyltransferase
MNDDPPVIRCDRLDLILLQPDVLRHSLAGDAASVERLLGLSVPDDWYEARDLMRIRLQQITAAPAYLPWSLRAIALRERRQMVGHIGFHTTPAPAYLQPFAPAAVEYGYTVFPPFRRRGYAREACRALMAWAHAHQGVNAFVLSIAPNNIPSRRLAQQLGFVKIGSHVGEGEGPEDIFRLDYRSID